MLYNILPEWLYNIINKNYLYDYIYELRIRNGKPITINYKGRFENLVETKDYSKNMILGSTDLINYILSISMKQSFYAYNEQIKQCFITTDSGIRIGLCGTVVSNNGTVGTLKNISSINIRIAHQVLNCSERIISFLLANGNVKNTLIISPPSAGKTTLVRDIVRKFSNEKDIQNILVVDERFEIAGLGSNSNIDIGNYVDVISGFEKQYAFDNALKTMNPSVIVTDEISKEKDIDSIKQAIMSGVKVIATAHANDIEDLKKKKFFDVILKDKYFERIIVLSKRNGVGTIECIYDENLRGIYIPYLLWKF